VLVIRISWKESVTKDEVRDCLTVKIQFAAVNWSLVASPSDLAVLMSAPVEWGLVTLVCPAAVSNNKTWRDPLM